MFSVETIIWLSIPVALIIGGGGLWIFSSLTRTRTAEARLSNLTGGLTDAQSDAEQEALMTAAVSERLAKLGGSPDSEEFNVLRERLLHAGYRNPNAPGIFTAVRLAVTAILPIVVTPIGMSLLDLSTTYALGLLVILACIGYFVPSMLLDSQISSRQKKLLAAFPDSLDLLVSSVEAGLALDSAFRRVANELKSAAPELSGEYQMVTYEVNAGVARTDAFRHLADRTGLDDVKGLVNMLVQAEKFGTSIANALRVHSDMMREKRMAMAEEKAARVSPTLTVLMILFLMPALVVILIGPAAINIMKIFGGNG